MSNALCTLEQFRFALKKPYLLMMSCHLIYAQFPAKYGQSPTIFGDLSLAIRLLLSQIYLIFYFLQNYVTQLVKLFETI